MHQTGTPGAPAVQLLVGKGGEAGWGRREQVQLVGFYTDEEEAARAFDVYVLETKGLGAQINFHPADYGIEVPELVPEEAAAPPLPNSSRGAQSPGGIPLLPIASTRSQL